MQISWRYLLQNLNYNPFCLKFCCHGNKGRSRYNSVGSIWWPNPEPPSLRCKDLTNISSRNWLIAHFVPNFIAMANSKGWGKISLAAFDGPTQKPPYGCKDLADISSRSRVIAHFVPNFVGRSRVDLNDTIWFTIPKIIPKNQKLWLSYTQSKLW